jgi:hypothetical protein
MKRSVALPYSDDAYIRRYRCRTLVDAVDAVLTIGTGKSEDSVLGTR